MTIQADIWDILILLGTMQGFVLSGLLLFSQKNVRVPANRWLAGLVWVLSQAGLGLVLGNWELAEDFPGLIFVPFLLQMAIGPLLYLYVRRLMLPGRSFTRTDIWHLVPILMDLRYLFVLILFQLGWVSKETVRACFHFPTQYTDALAWAVFVL